MSRRIDIELTSSREDGSWTWRAAGAREPKGTVDGAILPAGAEVGQVLRAEVEGYLDGMGIVAVMPPRAPRAEPERLELKSARADQPLVTSALAAKRSGERSGERAGERGRRRPERGREGDRPRRDRRGGRDRQDAHHERPSRPAPPPVEEKPKPKRLRPGRAHRSALLEAVPAEQRPIAEQLLAGGIPSVRQAIVKQNETLRAEGKPEVKPDALLRVAEDLRPRALAAAWRDRAEAAAAVVDDLDLRDLRSVVNAADDAGRDDEARALAAQLREALANRVEKEHAAWLAELAETVQAGRVVRALRLSSRPPKAGAPIPGDIATQLAEATAASLTDETGPERWATVLDALAYSPVRRRVVPQSLPARLSPDLRSTIARLATRLPEIAHIFDVEPDPAAERAARGQARRRPARKGDDRKPEDRKGDDRKGDDRKGDDRKADDRKADERRPEKRKADERKPDKRKAGRKGRGKGGDKARKAETDTRTTPAPEASAPEAAAEEAAAPEAAAPEAAAPEAPSPEAAAPEAAAPEAPSPEAAAPEAAAPEAPSSEGSAPEAPAPEAAAPEAPAPEGSAPEAAAEGAPAPEPPPPDATAPDAAASQTPGDATESAPAEGARREPGAVDETDAQVDADAAADAQQ